MRDDEQLPHAHLWTASIIFTIGTPLALGLAAALTFRLITARGNR